MPPFGKIANGVTILPSVRLANVLTGRARFGGRHGKDCLGEQTISPPRFFL